MPRAVWMLVAVLLLVVPACARGGAGEAEPDDGPVRVEVSSNFALPVEIYAIGNGATQRLGTVHPGMRGLYTVPQNLISAGGVELQARPTASGKRFASDRLLLAPGTIVDFVITPQLFNSTVTLRP